MLRGGFGAGRVRSVFRGEADDLLADLVPLQHVDERGRRVLDALGDRLAVLEPPLLEPAQRLGHVLAAGLRVVGDDEAAHGQALADHADQAARPGARLGVVGPHDHAAVPGPPVRAHAALRRLEPTAAPATPNYVYAA